MNAGTTPLWAKPFLIHAAEERRRHAGPDAQAASMYAGQTAWHARTRVEEAKIRAAFATTCPFPDAFSALHRLIYGSTTRHLASIDPVFADWGPQAGNTGIDALLHIALLSSHWLQSPEDWTPLLLINGDKRAGLASLARHLFCRYELPAFFDRAWLGGFDGFAQTFRLAFVHLGQGGKLEAVPFPCPMSHRAAHHFMHAPDDFSLPSALRSGQIKALNGHENLARALQETFLQNAQTDEAFWFTFVQFLINHDHIPLWQVGPLVDYVRFRKFGSQQTETEEDELPEGPEPDFSMKGRTPTALLHSMTEWHETLARISKKRAETWPASRTIAPLDLSAPDSCSALTCRWRVREITQSMELMEEGRAMRHCVSTYQDACEKGKTSLWSVRIVLFDPSDVSGGPKPVSRRLLTLEVNNHRRAIVQVRGKCNQSLPSMRAKNQRMKNARDILRDWASREHLGIACAI